jgi:hypothetical protein
LLAIFIAIPVLSKIIPNLIGGADFSKHRLLGDDGFSLLYLAGFYKLVPVS